LNKVIVFYLIFLSHAHTHAYVRMEKYFEEKKTKRCPKESSQTYSSEREGERKARFQLDAYSTIRRFLFLASR